MDAGVVSHVVTSPPQWVAAESSGGSPEHGAVTNTELGSLPLQEARSAVRWDAGCQEPGVPEEGSGPILP